MEPIKSCPNCGRENLQNSKYCKYCGYFIEYPIEPQKIPQNVLFEYIKENRDYFVVAGVFAALTVYLIQFYNSFKSQSFFVNGSFNSTTIQLLNNQSLPIFANSSNLSFSANISYTPIIDQTFFGNLLPIMSSPPTMALSLAVVACFTILLLMLWKIIGDIAILETDNYNHLFIFYSNNLSRLVAYYSLSIFALILLCYIVFSFPEAAVTFALFYIIGGVFSIAHLTFKYINKKSKFVILDHLIVCLIFLGFTCSLIGLIQYLLITANSLNSIIVILLLAGTFPGFIYGIFRGVIPSFKLIIKIVVNLLRQDSNG